MRLAMYACDEQGVIGALALGFWDRQLVLCFDCMNDARASLDRLCERLTVASDARDGILQMDQQTIVFPFAIEAQVTIAANKLDGTVIGLWRDREGRDWIYVRYVLATGAVIDDWFRPLTLTLAVTEPEAVASPTEPETAALDGRADELAPPLEAGHR